MLDSPNMRFEYIGCCSKVCLGRWSPKVIQGHQDLLSVEIKKKLQRHPLIPANGLRTPTGTLGMLELVSLPTIEREGGY